MSTKTTAKIETKAEVKPAAKVAAPKAAEKTVVAVSYGGNGFLVTETTADGGTYQYLSETDPTV